VWELRNSVRSYDAYYVALAEALDAPLVTCDDRLARAIGPMCEIVVP
jgi:predicted nucleic acid-binding protein